MPEYSISELGTFEDCALQYRLIKWHTEVKINRKERTGDDYKWMGLRMNEPENT
jgi:hypothetical protein